MATLLEVDDLSVYSSRLAEGEVITKDVSFSVERGEVLALIGESGSGKTITSKAITRLFPYQARLRVVGDVIFEGIPLLSLNEAQLAEVRRNKIRYVFQEPLAALNPLARVRSQMQKAAGNGETTEEHFSEVLREAGIAEPAEVMRSYPHQLSTGMAQRVMIAMAILPSPLLLIADEPTSSVDVSLRRRLLELLQSVRQNEEMSMILITHDIGIARHHADRLVLMYRGRVVESARRTDFFNTPLHPYAQMLFESADATHRFDRPLTPHAAGTLRQRTVDSGCRFAARCPKVQKECTLAEPPLEQVSETHDVRCFYWK
jgi:peptide/nickel transport system ATP-binding protein